MVLAFLQGKGSGSDARFRKGLKRDAAPTAKKRMSDPCRFLIDNASFDGADVDKLDIISSIR